MLIENGFPGVCPECLEAEPELLEIYLALVDLREIVEWEVPGFGGLDVRDEFSSQVPAEHKAFAGADTYATAQLYREYI